MSWVSHIGWWFLCGFQGGRSAVLGPQQPTFPNSRQIVHLQQQPEGQGQGQWLTHTYTYSSLMAKTVQLNCYSNILGMCFCVGMQPDGAESVASVHSSDTASEKTAANHHTTNSGMPTISVSRASVSSGTNLSLHAVWFGVFLTHAVILPLLKSHTNILISHFSEVWWWLTCATTVSCSSAYTL